MPFTRRPTAKNWNERSARSWPTSRPPCEDSDRALAAHLGIGRTDLRCLDLIVRSGPHSAGQIATALRLTPGSVTTLIDRLERAGYAARHADPHHGKRVLVAPTPELAAMIAPIVSRRVDQGRARLVEHTDAELTVIRTFLTATRTGHQQLSQALASGE